MSVLMPAVTEIFSMNVPKTIKGSDEISHIMWEKLVENYINKTMGLANSDYINNKTCWISSSQQLAKYGLESDDQSWMRIEIAIEIPNDERLEKHKEQIKIYLELLQKVVDQNFVQKYITSCMQDAFQLTKRSSKEKKFGILFKKRNNGFPIVNSLKSSEGTEYNPFDFKRGDVILKVNDESISILNKIKLSDRDRRELFIKKVSDAVNKKSASQTTVIYWRGAEMDLWKLSQAVEERIYVEQHQTMKSVLNVLSAEFNKEAKIEKQRTKKQKTKKQKTKIQALKSAITKKECWDVQNLQVFGERDSTETDDESLNSEWVENCQGPIILSSGWAEDYQGPMITFRLSKVH